jgi:hypothetical protein
MEKLLAAPNEPRPSVDQYSDTGFVVNGRQVHYPIPFQHPVAPTLQISKGMDSGTLYLRWEASGLLLTALPGQGFERQDGTVWDGPEGWWRKA